MPVRVGKRCRSGWWWQAGRVRLCPAAAAGRAVSLAGGPSSGHLQHVPHEVGQDEWHRKAEYRQGAPTAPSQQPRPMAVGRRAEEEGANQQHERQRDDKGDPVAHRPGGGGHGSAHQADDEGRPASGTRAGGESRARRRPDREPPGGAGSRCGAKWARARTRRRSAPGCSTLGPKMTARGCASPLQRLRLAPQPCQAGETRLATRPARQPSPAGASGAALRRRPRTRCRHWVTWPPAMRQTAFPRCCGRLRVCFGANIP
eukprot:scaffold10972_cov127-Isochrysis_galbana.AAC.7